MGAAVARCIDMPQRVPGTLCLQRSGLPPLPPGEAASSTVYLAASAQTPRFVACQMQQLPPPGP